LGKRALRRSFAGSKAAVEANAIFSTTHHPIPWLGVWVVLQVAVYTADGKRGHHMQDFIPPEELAKFMAKAKDERSQAHAEALEQRNKIGADNVGHRMLQKMGWKEGQGLGAGGSGIAAPVTATGATDGKHGLGTTAHGEVEEGDDEFELYRCGSSTVVDRCPRGFLLAWLRGLLTAHCSGCGGYAALAGRKAHAVPVCLLADCTSVSRLTCRDTIWHLGCPLSLHPFRRDGIASLSSCFGSLTCRFSVVVTDFRKRMQLGYKFRPNPLGNPRKSYY
jgi:G-patch domain